MRCLLVELFISPYVVVFSMMVYRRLLRNPRNQISFTKDFYCFEHFTGFRHRGDEFKVCTMYACMHKYTHMCISKPFFISSAICQRQVRTNNNADEFICLPMKTA